MRRPESCTYIGYLYRDGRFVGEREEKIKRGSAVDISSRPLRRLQTLLKAFSQGFPAKLMAEGRVACAKEHDLLLVAQREYPYEPIRLTEAVNHLPPRLQSRLFRMQQKSMAAENPD